MIDQRTINLISGLHLPLRKQWVRHLEIVLIVGCYLAMAAIMFIAARNTMAAITQGTSDILLQTIQLMHQL
jgi:hypothetical protein